MIELYTCGTPNGRKASVMLEETGLAYEAHTVDLLAGAQHEPAFLAINPNGKIPAIIDRDGPGGGPYTLFGSGAILIYLAEKAGSKLLPSDARARHDTIQWLMFQMGFIGPMLGQYHHFHSHAPERVPYGLARYGKEVNRLYDVMEERLSGTAYLAGEGYTIADIASFAWVERFERPDIDMDMGERPALRRWFGTVAARPAVARGMQVPA